jgi:urea transport system substrate-binding protein
MIKLFGRRKLIIFGSTVASSVFLKACSTKPSTNSDPKTSLLAFTTFKGTIKVGILHSLSGSLAMSEKSVVDAERLAIEEINNWALD